MSNSYEPYCDRCDDTGKIHISVSGGAMGSGIRTCPDCEGLMSVPVEAVRRLLAGNSQLNERHALFVLRSLLPPAQCPAVVNPYPGGMTGVRRIQCEGKEGHDGPHQVPDEAWMVPK